MRDTRARIYYVSYGHGQDRDILRVRAIDEAHAIEQAYHQVGPINSVWPARRAITPRVIRGMKSLRKQGFNWSEIAWSYRLSVPTVKKYVKGFEEKSG